MKIRIVSALLKMGKKEKNHTTLDSLDTESKEHLRVCPVVGREILCEC